MRFSDSEDTIPDSKEWSFSYQEVAAMMIKRIGVREGHWGVSIKFNNHAVNLPAPNGKLVPACVVEVMELSLQRSEAPNELTVNAGEVWEKEEAGFLAAISAEAVQ